MSRLVANTLLLIALVYPGMVMGAYSDPLDLPATKHAGASRSLLLDVVPIGKRFIAVGERGTIISSDDAGGNWRQADVDTRAHLNAVTFVDDKFGWAVGEDSVIVHTTDGGLIWQRQYEDRNASDMGPLLDLYFRDRQTGFAVGVFGKLLRTTDGGKTWRDWSEHIENEDLWHLTGITASENGDIYISGEAGFIYRSQDGGETFVPEPYVARGTYFGLLVRQKANGVSQLVGFGIAGQLVVCTDGPDSCASLASGVDSGLLGGTWLPDGSAVIVGNDGVSLRLSPDLTTVEPFPVPVPSLFGAAAVLKGKMAIVGYDGVQVIETPATAAAPTPVE